MSLNFHHSAHSPRCKIQHEPLDSEDLPSTSRKVDGCQILLKIERKIALSVVVELTAFQRKVLDVDENFI
jgi:hypothetical protein